jgi:hypothetical protein
MHMFLILETGFSVLGSDISFCLLVVCVTLRKLVEQLVSLFNLVGLRKEEFLLLMLFDENKIKGIRMGFRLASSDFLGEERSN